MKSFFQKHKILFGVVCVLTAAVMGYSAGNAKDPFQEAIAEKILRFHVLANSDSEEDQEIKEIVRDAIGAYMEPKLAEAEDLAATRRIVEENLENIELLAGQVLEENGFSYGVNAALEYTEFPEKTYGAYTFPAGEYEALRVVLGEGQGHNWWCVLYPNMCFRGSVFEIVDEEAELALKEVLTPEEYADVFNSGEFQVRFKILEYFR